MARTLVLWCLASLLQAAPSMSSAQAPAGELLERTLAVVGGAVVTQSDVTLARTLRLLDGGPVPESDLLTRLVDRELMLQEVARFAPPEPEAAAVAARLETVRAYAGGAAALETALVRSGRELADLEAWVRDDLRIAAYLDQRFVSAGAPPESELTAWIAAHPAEVAALAPAEATRIARERIAQARRADLISDWLADVRRRVDVVRFAPPGGLRR